MLALLIFFFWNMIVFFLYGLDKYYAKANKWRISEATLLTCAFFMGAMGAFGGMKIFHHKTRHTKFTVLVPIFLILNLIIVAALTYLTYSS